MKHKDLEFGNPILFRTPFWLDLPSDDTVKLQFKPLSFKDIREVEYSNYLGNLDFLTEDEIILRCLIDTFNVHGFPSNAVLVTQLSKDDKASLVNSLILMSTLTSQQQDNLESVLSVALSPRLQGDNWDCATCVHKKLQPHRACGYTDPSTHLEFKMKINNKVYTKCPISTLDKYITYLASEAYKLFDSGTLPEDGGVGNQTLWAVQAATIYKKLLNQLEAERLGSN